MVNGKDLLTLLFMVHAAPDEREGICGNLQRIMHRNGYRLMMCREYNEELQRLFASWPERSTTSRAYPVEGVCSEYQWHLFKWSGKYGPARHRLLVHCIETLERELGLRKP